MKLPQLILLLLSSNFLSAQFWQQLANYPGGARDDAAVFVINNKAYCFSGLQSNGQCQTDGYVFDMSSQTWTTMQSMPINTGRQYAMAFTNGTDGFVLGGVDNSGNCYQDFWKYNVATNTWIQLPNFPGTARGGGSTCVINNKAYVFGGKTSSYVFLTDAWEYDFTTTTWTQKGNLPISGFWRGTCAVSSGLAYIAFGKKNETAPVHNRVIHSYNPSNDTWNLIPNIYLPAISYVACEGINNKIIFYGGQDSTSNFFHNTTFVFDATTNSLTTLSSLPASPIKGCVAFTDGIDFYFTTGLQEGVGRVQQTWRLTNPVNIKKNKEPIADVLVFPNPCGRQLTIKYNNENNLEINVYNSAGQLIFSKTNQENKLVIDCSTWVKGIYFLKLINENLQVYTSKLIVE